MGKADDVYTPEQRAAIQKMTAADTGLTPVSMPFREAVARAGTLEVLAVGIELERAAVEALWPAEKLLKPASEREAKPKSKPKQERKSYWDDAVDRVLRENFLDNDAKNFAPKDVVKKVLEVLDPDIKKTGRKPPSRGLILRKSGHWKT